MRNFHKVLSPGSFAAGGCEPSHSQEFHFGARLWGAFCTHVYRSVPSTDGDRGSHTGRLQTAIPHPDPVLNTSQIYHALQCGSQERFASFLWLDSFLDAELDRIQAFSKYLVDPSPSPFRIATRRISTGAISSFSTIYRRRTLPKPFFP